MAFLFLLPALILAQSEPQLKPYDWNLTEFYRSETDWRQSVDHLTNSLKLLPSFRGKLRDPNKLADCLALVSQLRRSAGQLAVYGYLRSWVDPESTKVRNQRETGERLEAAVESAASFVWAYVAERGLSGFESAAKRTPKLKKYEETVWNELKMARTRLPAAKGLLESAARWPKVCDDTRLALLNEIQWPTLGIGGNKVIADAGSLSNRQITDFEQKSSLAQAHFTKEREYIQTLGALFVHRVEADMAIAKARGFSNSLDAFYFLKDGFPHGTGQTLLAEVREMKPLLQRYLALRKRALGQGGYGSLFTRPVLTQTYTVQGCLDMALKIVRPLGPEFAKHVRAGIDNGYLYLPPVPSGAFGTWYPVGGKHSYGVIDFSGSHSSARRLVGALITRATHDQMLSYHIPDTRNDPPLIGNTLLDGARCTVDDEALSRAITKEDKKKTLIYMLDIARYFFLYGIAGELENWVRERLESGVSPTGPEISAKYLSLIRDYYGHDAGLCETPDWFGNEWMDMDLLFASSELQFFSLEDVGAAQLHEWQVNGDPRFKKVVEAMLKGKSHYSHDLLSSVGMDLTKPAAYDALKRRFKNLCDQLEANLEGTG